MGSIHDTAGLNNGAVNENNQSLRRRPRRAVFSMVMAAAAFVVGGFATPDAARAQDRSPVVVELYTSQGCSSCPPADALMAELAKRGDVIALSLHVDYWDYIGWKDKFANPAFTARQKAYARQGKRRSIYTPQMIVGGTDDVVGAHPKDVATLISKHGARPAPVALTATRNGNQISLLAAALPQSRSMMAVQVVHYKPRAEVQILHGENAGKTVEYVNIVTGWQRVAEWDGQGALAIDLTVNPQTPAVVIIQEIAKRGPGAILAAVEVK